MRKCQRFLAIMMVVVILIPLSSLANINVLAANSVNSYDETETELDEEGEKDFNKEEESPDYIETIGDTALMAGQESDIYESTTDNTGSSDNEGKELETESSNIDNTDVSDYMDQESETESSSTDSTGTESILFAEEIEPEKNETENSQETNTEGEIEISGEEQVIVKDAMNSLVPLEEKEVCLLIKEVTDEKLSHFPVDEMVASFKDSNGNSVPIEGNPSTVWRYVKDTEDGIETFESYDLNSDAVIDLSLAATVPAYRMELIIGSGTQLNTENVRYIVTVYLSDEVYESIGIELYEQTESGVRKEATVSKTIRTINTQFGEMEVYQYVVPGYTEDSLYYLGITSEAAKHPNCIVEVYTFEDFISGRSPITSQILNQNMELSGAGYSGHFKLPENNNYLEVFNEECGFFVIEEKDKANNATSIIYLNISIISDIHDISHVNSTLFKKDGSNITDVVCREVDSFSVSDLYIDMEANTANAKGVHEYFFMLNEGVSANDELYCRFNAYGDVYKEKANEYVTKAVVGLYSSLDEASGQEDIKDQLFPTDPSDKDTGYKANYYYENGGVYFTAFFEDNNVWQFNVRVMDYDPEYDEEYIRSYIDSPIVGSKDPWFRVVGAESIDGATIPTNIVENGKSINMDTMYGYGYQTVFINDPSVSTIIPVIEKADSDTARIDRIYVDGHEYDEGDTIELAGNETTKMFNTVIVDENGGEHTKNYNVSFVKVASGPKLYVVDPKGGNEDDPVRSVFLDEYFEYKHDILIANIGDEELTGLRVELNATNVKLDDYWTVGGEGTDTLAPVDPDAASLSDSTELPNIAKIRLLPDGVEGGEIKGTLTIYAKGQDPVIIKLSGRAQNPSITTEEELETVKYVPYSFMITTNNMYDWNTVTFSHTGEIPGMTFNDATGEIYGAPLQAGTYTISVKAEYGRDDYFEPSTKKITIKVLDNENETVFNTSDDEYKIIPEEDGDNGYVGEQVSAYDFVVTSFDEDEVFISEGEYDQFEKLWLNGEVLTEGVDYTKEPGSTRIIINAESLEDKTNEGRNTISAEFNVDEERGEKLKRTSQNFRVELASKEEENKPASTAEENKPASTARPANQNNDEETRDTDEQDADTVNIITHVVGADDKALANYIIEMHSTVKTANTDASGNASFESMEMGQHTVYIKNEKGTTVASKNFTLRSGSSLSRDGDTITIVPGQTVMMTIKVEGSKASIVNVKSANSSFTGDAVNTQLWIILIMMSMLALSRTIAFRKHHS